MASSTILSISPSAGSGSFSTFSEKCSEEATTSSPNRIIPPPESWFEDAFPFSQQSRSYDTDSVEDDDDNDEDEDEEEENGFTCNKNRKNEEVDDEIPFTGAYFEIRNHVTQQEKKHDAVIPEIITSPSRLSLQYIQQQQQHQQVSISRNIQLHNNSVDDGIIQSEVESFTGPSSQLPFSPVDPTPSTAFVQPICYPVECDISLNRYDSLHNAAKNLAIHEQQNQAKQQRNENLSHYHELPRKQQLSKLVGSPLPSPSWTEISSEILPSAARELLSSSLHRLYYTARKTYSQTKWESRYSDYGNNATGYFQQQPHLFLRGSEAGMEESNSSHYPNIDNLPRFSSLSWVDRQMVKEWRTYHPDQESNNSNKEKTSEINQRNDLASMKCINSKSEKNENHFVELEEESDRDFDYARTLVPAPLTRPVWQKDDVCFACHKTFGPTLLRHHCRLCGISVCHGDSRHRRKLPHLGYHPDIPERVCDTCANIVWEQNLAERIAWRLARCRDYKDATLTPYFEVGVDSLEQKAYRITQAAITMAKSIPLGAQATVAVETADILRKYGFSGIYTIMMRQEFLAAADLLRKALGINQTAWPLSVHELSAAIFYALAQHRAMRGLDPEREHFIHSFKGNTSEKSNDARNRQLPNEQHHSAEPEIDNITDGRRSAINDSPNATDISLDDANLTPSFTPVCDPVPDSVLSDLIFYAPLALNFIYLEKEVDVQLLAAQQGWRLIYSYLNSELDGSHIGDMNPPSGKRRYHNTHDRPASALFVHEVQKIACIAIRGTSTVQDVITDIRQVSVPFPESATRPMRESNDGDEEWTDVTFQGQGVAVAGMASAAFNLYREHIDSLLLLFQQGYQIRFTGHSLGGAVATLLGVLVYRDLKGMSTSSGSVRSNASLCTRDKSNSDLKVPLLVYSYGTPSCVDMSLADVVESFVFTAVLHDDVVPRLTPATCRGLLKHLLHIRETWVKTEFPDDVKAFTDRAKTAWAPRWRGGFTLRNATNSSIKLKRYCRNQLHYGKKRLLTVKEKIIGDNNARCKSYPLTTYSTSYRSLETGRRSFVDDHSTIGYTVEIGGARHTEKEEVENQKDESAKSLTVIDYMGGIDSRTGEAGMVVDGDEFFDPDSVIADSSDDCHSTSSSEADFDENIMVQSLNIKQAVHHDSRSGETRQISCEINESGIEMYARLAPETTMEKVECDDDEDNPETVVLEEIPLPRMFVPGKIVHMYSHRGVYKAAFVPRNFREIRHISMAGNMLSDHKTKSYYDALLEVRSVRRAPESPPLWTAFDEDDTCSCCASRFTWASTSDSEAQQARDKHNCRSCGALVCNPCSENRVPIPSIGLTSLVRVCDRCYYNDLDKVSPNGHSVDARINCIMDQSLTDDETKPIRQRTKRSGVVDDLAARVQASPLHS